MELPTLYKTTATGATQVLNITIVDDVYTRTWGQLDGKMQTKATTAVGLNIGKSNETSSGEQALKEANAVWIKKQKANYSTSTAAPVLVELPMKVKVYQDHINKIAPIVYCSPKLNGVNLEYRKKGKDLELLSRGGEQRPIPPHQVTEIHNLMRKLGVSRLNGEQYIHGEHLQDISSACTKLNELSPRLEFHVFDLPTMPGDYERREACMALEEDQTFVKIIPTALAHTLDEIDEMFKECIEAGYEGLIVRNPTGLYKYNTKSSDVFKYKETMDAEFLAVNYATDKNGHTVFVCQVKEVSEDGTFRTFKVKLKGTNEERLEMTKIAYLLEGKHLKVEYEMLSKDGIPLKPVGIMFRKVDENGEAIE